jgi:SSS family solute:Na+ symporter
VLIAIVVSYLTKAPDQDQIQGLTFGHVSEEQKQENRNSYGIGDILATIAIVAVIAWIMYTFS